MFGRSWRIARIAGIDVSVDTSWFILALLIVFSWFSLFRDAGIRTGTALAVAGFAALLFFVSILAHELAHALMARIRRMRVTGITLFLFGGATSTEADRRPLEEFLVTVVGPLTSLAVGFLYMALSHASFSGAVRFTFHELGRLNVFLAILNALPALPLDGGRVLHSAVWGATRDRDRATKAAGAVGAAVGLGLIALGFYQLGRPDSGGLYGGWLAFIGFVVFQQSRQAAQAGRLRNLLSTGVAREAMGPPPTTIPAGVSLSEALDRYLQGHEEESFPVVEGERLVGVLTWEGAQRVGADDPLRPVRDAMTPADQVRTVSSEDTLERAAEVVGRGGAALVLRGDEPVGTISLRHIDRWLREQARR